MPTVEKNSRIVLTSEVTVGALVSTLLLSVQFICLHVVYREVFWEELSRPI